MIDLSRPVAVLLVVVLHFVRDAEGPEQVVATFRDALAPGAYMAISHLSSDGPPDDETRKDDTRRLDSPAALRGWAERTLSDVGCGEPRTRAALRMPANGAMRRLLRACRAGRKRVPIPPGQPEAAHSTTP